MKVLVALLLLAGCASPSCFVGISIIPPGPFISCGVDIAPQEWDDLDV